MTSLPLRAPLRRGFTLVEAMAVLAVAGVLAAVAMPTYLNQIVRSRRVDATTALQRLQWSQERFRRDTGAYALRLDQLRNVAAGRSEAGLYRLELHSLGPDAYEAVAVAQAEQARDLECPTLTLRVDGLVSDRQPAGRCWGQ
jgi:type IV pilus assembly protein PilE